MYAIVEIAGQQFKVQKDQKIFVHRLAEKEGDNVTFDKVLLTDDGKKVNIGTPTVIGAVVKAKVLSHMRGDKVLVFKKKRRKGYQKLNGHRQDLSQIEIEDITLNGKAAAKKATAKKPETKEQVKKEVVKKEAPKKAEAKKVVKKETTKKTEAKTSKPDKLTKIEGIGPKIAGILADAGMDTFKKLSTAKAEKISEILVAAGGNAYNRFDPDTWPKQAKLAADGKWDELQKLQDELNGGKA
ncbi:MAG: 50S ribosomal protein L21 [Bacteroidales bacterium]|nr:50S ribosomal protein L21 [Bacteroidales bacterium]